MTAGIQPVTHEERLLLRGRAIGLCARLVSEESGRDDTGGELVEVLGRLEVAAPPLNVQALARPLVKGEVPPYETSYEAGPGSSGGPTFQMADIAGFYRAFGFQVMGERPDHVVPEMEFVALMFVKEAYALLSGDADGADVCAGARRKFVAEHLGRWLPMLRDRALEVEGAESLVALVGVIVRLVETED